MNVRMSKNCLTVMPCNRSRNISSSLRVQLSQARDMCSLIMVRTVLTLSVLISISFSSVFELSSKSIGKGRGGSQCHLYPWLQV